ncbi:MAG TPA: hypothetical protein VFK30_05365, partial [Anaerolineae bacterium]|nr:hypothetical protein [Anaerolineae bacterium]
MQFSHTGSGQFTYSTGGGTFNNAGVVTKTAASSGFTYIYVPFNNSGSVTANAGTFYLGPAAATTNNNSGQLSIAYGASLQVAGSGTVNFNAGSSLTGAGAVTFSSGTTNFKAGSTYAISNTQVNGGTADFSATSAVTFDDVTLGSGTLRIGTVSVTGDFTRTAGTFMALAGTLTFNGGAAQHLELDQPTTFNNFGVVSGTTVIETAVANNGIVSGTLSNHGIIRKTEVLSATKVYTFGLTGAVISVASTGSLSSTVVDFIGQPPPETTSIILSDYYWAITPSGSGYTAALKLPHRFSPPSDVNICHFNSGTLHWGCSKSSYTANTITWAGLTALEG